jgi:hypothetical protein
MGIAFVVMGVVVQAGLFVPGDFVVIGIAAAAYSWLTTPLYYNLYDDRLVVLYGRPRIRHVLFQDIADIEVPQFNFGNRMWIRLKSGRRVVIQPKALGEFQDRFKEAVESHLGGTEEQGPQEQGPIEES